MDEKGKNAISPFGRRTKMLRRQKKFSLDELGREMGFAKATLSKYENGLLMPNLESARRFSVYYKVPLDWLAGEGRDDTFLEPIPQGYLDAVRYAMENNISVEKVMKAVNFISEIQSNDQSSDQ